MHSTRRFHAKGAFRRLRRYFETRSLRYCAGLFAVLLGLVALAAPSPYCIENPGPTQDVLGELSGRSGGEVIAVEGADTYTDEGELLLTTVNASGVPGYPVSNIVALIGWFDPDTVVMPNEAVVPIGQTAEEYAGESQQEMDQSQQEAVDAALAFLQDRGVDVSGVDVDMHVEGIGGPSAGMMYALGLIDKLTPESETGGRTIAGTGTIDAEGNVGAIGGVPEDAGGQARRRHLVPRAGGERRRGGGQCSRGVARRMRIHAVRGVRCADGHRPGQGG